MATTSWLFDSAVRDRERSGRRAYHRGRENHGDGAGSSRRQ